MMISVKTFMHQKQTLAKISGPEIIFAETHTRAPPPPNPPLEFRKWCCKVARQKFRPKSSKGATKKKILAEFWLILPKTGRKGAAENLYIVY
jgi:hypothetical protein